MVAVAGARSEEHQEKVKENDEGSDDTVEHGHEHAASPGEVRKGLRWHHGGHVAHAGVLADLKNVLPALAGIGRFST